MPAESSTDDNTPSRRKDGTFSFPDYPEFRPNLSPREVFKMGSFGGTYWRPIYSSVTKKNYRNQHLKYPKSWWKGIPKDHLTRAWKDYDPKINKYNVKCGSTLEFWEEKDWITKYNPYGWMQWYCDFFSGKRNKDDNRQISRWLKLAGPKGRFRNSLITYIQRKSGQWDDYSVSPPIRQTLQHGAYQLTKKDYLARIKSK